MASHLVTLKRWWRYGVLRGEGVPADLDGRWYEIPATDDPAWPQRWTPPGHAATFTATNMWEQREDGEVAVVYRLTQMS